MMPNPPGGYPPPPGGPPPGGYPPGPPGGYPPGPPPGGYPPQGAYPPPGSYPPGYYQGAPPPEKKGGRSCLFYVLSGCGCFFLVCLLSFAGLAWWAKGQVDKAVAAIGTVDDATIARKLGDVPTYPGAKLDVNTTTGILAVSYFLETWWFEAAPGSIVTTLGVYKATDSPDKILAFYDRQMTRAGWKVSKTGTDKSGDRQHIYQKANELAAVYVDQGQEDNLLVVRGGPKLLELIEKSKNAPTVPSK